MRQHKKRMMLLCKTCQSELVVCRICARLGSILAAGVWARSSGNMFRCCSERKYWLKKKKKQKDGFQAINSTWVVLHTDGFPPSTPPDASLSVSLDLSSETNPVRQVLVPVFETVRLKNKKYKTTTLISSEAKLKVSSRTGSSCFGWESSVTDPSCWPPQRGTLQTC